MKIRIYEIFWLLFLVRENAASPNQLDSHVFTVEINWMRNEEITDRKKKTSRQPEQKGKKKKKILTYHVKKLKVHVLPLQRNIPSKSPPAGDEKRSKELYKSTSMSIKNTNWWII